MSTVQHLTSETFEAATAQPVDVDAEPTLAAHFGVRSIPTLVVLRDGVPVAGRSGVVPADALVKALDRVAVVANAEPSLVG
jgi:thioredoxin-like negative regulator of GroEL